MVSDHGRSDNDYSRVTETSDSSWSFASTTQASTSDAASGASDAMAARQSREPRRRVFTSVDERDTTDIVLVAGAQRGDKDALDQLLRRHYDRVFAICRRVTNNEADAFDASQHALMSISRGIGKFDGTSSFTTWMHRVATNAALDELRRRKRRAEPHSFDEQPPEEGERPSARLAGSEEVGYGRSEDRVAIDAALAKIPPEFRAPVVLRDLCGLDYAEIAEVLNVPPGTVRSRIARGRAALVPHLAAYRAAYRAGSANSGGSTGEVVT
jgi:RNA polymerase sigma-70 factor, ECF subfamily